MTLIMTNLTLDKTYQLDLIQRPRRLRQSRDLRAMIAETDLKVADLVMPMFVFDGNGHPQDIPSMPGIVRHNLQTLVTDCDIAYQLGVRCVMVFPCVDPSLKDLKGSEATNPESLMVRIIRAIKKRVPQMLVVSDVALDPYTSHGHDGIWDDHRNDVINDLTVQTLCEMSLLHAQAGADFIGPSDMMDGRVGAIRRHLDAHGYVHTGIMSYTAKYASSYFGPFRDAVGSAGTAGREKDKGTYQLNPANRREALVEAQLDTQEGADILMVKPAGAYLDVIMALRQNSHLPIAAYQVSGEYAQLHAAAQRGWLNLERCRYESLLAIKRAGADLIISYFARDMAEALSQG